MQAARAIADGMAQTTASGTTQRPDELLERSRQISALGESLAAVQSDSRGRLVFIGGEAGVGKTVLVRQFCVEHSDSQRIVWGACEPLFTPRPLAPFVDIGQATGGELEELVTNGARPHEIAAALTRELGEPTILVIEDVHWADEASLDVLRLTARKIATVQGLALVTYRDDSLDRVHPLRTVLGELAADPAVARLRLEPLSPQAVAELAAPYGVDADGLYRTTGGNPFFVTEVLASGDGEIPHTVRDAVLARAVRLSPTARTLLDTVAITPPHSQLWLLERLAPDAVQSLEECLSSGMLTADASGVAFRHELARLAIEESLAPDRALALHQKALEALAAPPDGEPDLARLAHHADAANDTAAVLRFAPAAGERAASLGAHREAAAQFGRALRYAENLPIEAEAGLLERRSYECYLIDEFDESVEAESRAVERYRELGDRLKEGAALCALSRRIWCGGRTAEAAEASRSAVDLLEQLPPGRELALAYGVASAICLNSEDAEGTFAWGARALELAERLDYTEVVVYALNNMGTMRLLLGDAEGSEMLDRSLDLAKQAGLDEPAGRAFIHFGWALSRNRAYDELEERMRVGIEFCNEHGLSLWELYLRVYRARSELDRGRWDEAAETARFVLDQQRSATLLRTLALVVLALVRARRGDPDTWPLLDEAHALAETSEELQAIVPVAAARAETAWLAGDIDPAGEATEEAFMSVQGKTAPWAIGELACWRWRARVLEAPPPHAAEPYALQIAGEASRAAERWHELGCPYEAALALADSDDEGDLRRALDELQQLGARPAAALVARRLRERGARGLPRGPRPLTRQNPANLTPRELEVLGLVAEGLRNAEIAGRLVLSQKTVEHHVSAILRKLEVGSRSQAVSAAVRLGLAAQHR
jgi:DNA-binding CsgD family transcriptional regulator